MVCNKNELKNLYISVYEDRLRHRVIPVEYSQLKENMEYLFYLNLKLSKLRKSTDWTIEDLKTEVY